MLERFRKKINSWSHRWLTLGGRYIMIQAVLSQLLVYWGHLFYLSANMVEDINRIIGRFLWNGSRDSHKIHLARLSSICRSKDHDGWGILDTRNFNIALLVKSFWRATNGSGIWSQIIKSKYLTRDSLHFLCHEFRFPTSYSAIWGSFKKILGHITVRLTWLFRDGSRIPICNLNMLGLDCQTKPSDRLIHFLAHRGICHLSQTISSWTFGALIFKNAQQLGLHDEIASEWDHIHDSLIAAGVCYSAGGDCIIWDGPMAADLPIVKDIYHIINFKSYSSPCSGNFA